MANGGDGVAEGEFGLAIPAGRPGTDGGGTGFDQSVHPDRHQGEQPEQRRGGACDRQHWRWVSTPRWARTSWNVVSTRQRETNQPRISAEVVSRSVARNACGRSFPAGSRVSTQRIGAGGRPL